MNTYPMCVLARGSGGTLACMDLSPVVSKTVDPNSLMSGWIGRGRIELDQPNSFGFDDRLLRLQLGDEPKWSPLLDALGEDTGAGDDDARWIRLVLLNFYWLIPERATGFLVPSIITFDEEQAPTFCEPISIDLTIQRVAEVATYIACRDRWRAEQQKRERSGRALDEMLEQMAVDRKEFYRAYYSRRESVAESLDVFGGQVISCYWHSKTSVEFGALLLLHRTGHSETEWKGILVGTGSGQVQPGTLLRQHACWLPAGEWSTLQTSRSIDVVRRDKRLTWIERPLGIVS